MRKSRFTEEQMVKILRECDRSPVADVAKKHGVSEQTLYIWRKKFGTMEAADAKLCWLPNHIRYAAQLRLRELRTSNASGEVMQRRALPPSDTLVLESAG